MSTQQGASGYRPQLRGRFLFEVVWWGMKKCLYIKVREVGRCAVTDVVRLAAVWAISSTATAHITTTRPFPL